MKSLLFVSTVILFVACGTPPEPNLMNEKDEPKMVSLASSDLYNGTKIDAFLQLNNSFNDKAKELFLKGVDAFRNKGDLDSAKFYFEKSIVGFPTANAYYDLGNVYLEKEEYAMASKAYAMAEHLDYEPFSKIVYNRAVIAAKQDNPDEALNYIEIAIQAGFHDLEMLNKDSNLVEVRKLYEFNETILRGLRGMSNTENLFWLQFKKEFPLIEFPLSLDALISTEQLNQLNFISYDSERFISEMRDEKFAREVSKGFYYVGHFNRTDEVTCILYLVKDEYYDETGPIIYRLASFNSEGKILDKKDVAGAESYEGDFMRTTFKDDFSFEIASSRPLYKNDVDEFGYYDNEIVDYDSVGFMNYFIQENGKIREQIVEEVELVSEQPLNESEFN